LYALFLRSLLTGEKEQTNEAQVCAAAVESASAGKGALRKLGGALKGFFSSKEAEQVNTNPAVNAMAALLNCVLLMQQGSKVSGILALRRAYNGFHGIPEYGEEAAESVETTALHSTRLFGVGTFKLYLSFLPPRVLSLIKFVGFEGNRAEGCELLRQCSSLHPMLTPWCHIHLLVREMIEARFSIDEKEAVVHYEAAWGMAGELMETNPTSPFFPWIASQVARSTGRLEESCSLMDRSLANAGEVGEDFNLDRMEKEQGWCLFAKMDWKGVIETLEPLMQRQDCMLRAWCGVMLGCACGMVGKSKNAAQYMACVELVANETDMDQAFVAKSKVLLTRVRPETSCCEMLYHLQRLNAHQPRSYLEAVEKMCSMQEGDEEPGHGERLAMVLIRGVVLGYLGHGEQGEALLSEQIIAPYEDGTATGWALGGDEWVVPNAYMHVGGFSMKQGGYPQAQECFDKAAAFGTIAFGNGFQFQLKNTSDALVRKLEEQAAVEGQ